MITAIVAILMCGYIAYQVTCLSGHDFQNNGNVDICSKCQLIRRKIKK